MRVSLLFGVLIPIATVSDLYGAQFIGLGDLPGGDFSSLALGVSADGSVVVGWSATDLSREAFKWTREDGIVGLGILEGDGRSRANAASADGSVIVGTSEKGSRGEAFIWTAESGLVGLEFLTLTNANSAGTGVSADGSVVVGWSSSDRASNIEAFRWTSENEMVGLGLLRPCCGGDTPGLRSFARGISADGSVVVGDTLSIERVGNTRETVREAFRWTEETGLVGLGTLNNGFFSFSAAVATSADGSVVVGSSALGDFRWTAAEGIVTIADDFAEALAVSADGSVIVGSRENNLGEFVAFLWDSTNGMRDIQEVLSSDFGLELQGWELSIATGISADGRTIVGNGRNPEGNMEAWLVVIPEPSTILLIVFGSLGLGGSRWRSREVVRLGGSWRTAVKRLAANFGTLQLHRIGTIVQVSAVADRD